MMMVVKGHQFHLFIFVNIFVIIIVFFSLSVFILRPISWEKNMDKIYGRYKLRNLYYDKWKILTLVICWAFCSIYLYCSQSMLFNDHTDRIYVYISVTFNFRQEKIGKRRICNWILTLRKYILEVPFKLEQHW